MKKGNLIRKIFYEISLLRYINKPILILTLLFAILGAFLILDASSISSVLTYGLDSPYYFFIRQLKFIAASLLISLGVMLIPTRYYKFLSRLLSYAFIGVLAYVYFKNSLFSSDVTDVTLALGNGKFQPAEFLKIFLIMYMGAYYGVWANKKRHAKLSFTIPLILCGVSAGLILFGGDVGSAAIMLALYALVFMSVPTKEKWVRRTKYLACGGLILCTLVLKFGYLVIPEKVLESDYRLNRLIYKSPCDRYEENSGYQVCNGYIAIDNGGMMGTGIGESVQKYLYLPASHTDFIFPIVVEELGVITGIAIIISYVVLIFLVFKVAIESVNLQNSIICYGIAIYFMLHIFVNLGGVLGIIPLTGVPLPFLSYGGSFCITVICSFAIVQRIHIENREEEHKKILKGESK